MNLAMALKATAQIPGRAEGEVLKLARPISFWGGVDPVTGRISDPRHPNHGAEIAGRILVLPGMIGSSSSSYIMLELMAIGRAPAALVLAAPDAILGLGVVVAREMGYGAIPVVVLEREPQAALATGQRARIGEDGTIEVLG
jgi:predicted aconitase with swiveling domain